MLTHHLRPPARSRPRRDGAGRRLGQRRAGCGCAPGSGAFSLARSSTTYLARHLPPIYLSAPAPRSPAWRRRRRCHPPSRPRRWPPAPRRPSGERAIGALRAPCSGAPGSPGSGAQRYPLPSHATLPSLPPSAERWPSDRLKPPADVCPGERLSRDGARSSSNKGRDSMKQCHEQASEGG